MTPEPDLERMVEQEMESLRAELSGLDRASLPEPIGTGWKALLLRGKRGGVLAQVANALIALRHAPEWQGVLHFNESSMATVAKVQPPFVKAPAVPFTWADEYDVLTAAWLQHQGIEVNRDIAGQAVHAVSKEHPFHPIREYVDSLRWDGTPRIDDWLTTYLGAVTSDYVRAVGAKFLIGAIARLFRPGAKNDTCPILEGAQGALKSTALRVLAGHNFFTDDIAELGSKDSAMQTRGVWIIELSELDSMTRGETSRVKAFVSRQVDRIRPPYGRHVVAAPRECVFAGTTNKDCYLRDETGSRRFWPIRCGFVNIPDLTRDRDQLWAEARERYNDGETWWFDTNEMVTSAAEETQARYEGDPWDELISTWLVGSNPESVSVTEVLLGCIAKKPEHWVQGDKNRVGRSLVSLGWERRYTGPRGAREWRYYPKPQLGNGVPV